MIAIQLLFLFVLAIVHSSCNGESYEEKEARQRRADETVDQERRQRFSELVNAFSAKHNADGTWLEPIKDKTVTTFKLQQSLIRLDGRPILALANIIDVEKRNDSFRLLFYVPRVGSVSLQKQYLVLDLQCSISEPEALALTVEQFYPYMDPKYLLAARIQNVKQVHQMKDNLIGDSDNISSMQNFKMEFIGEGKCVGLERLKPIAEDTTSVDAERPRMRR